MPPVTPFPFTITISLEAHIHGQARNRLDDDFTPAVLAAVPTAAEARDEHLSCAQEARRLRQPF